MKTTRTPSCQCPHCHTEFDSITNLSGGEMPKPGAWTICLRCCAVLRFTDTQGVRAIDEMERLTLENGPDWPEFSKLIDLIKQGRGRRER